jgi:hypothetical protein
MNKEGAACNNSAASPNDGRFFTNVVKEGFRVGFRGVF